jgi:hypothetical protein
MDNKTNKELDITRRNTLKVISLFAGYTLTAGSTLAFMSGCKTDTSDQWRSKSLTSDQIELLKQVTERILPRTDTPGANDALVERYIDESISEIWREEDKIIFINKLTKFDEISRSKYKKKFLDLKVDNKDDVIRILAEEWKERNNSEKHIFKEIRDLTLAGFASSEVGAKEFFIFDPIPGPYEGCIPYSDVNGTYAL